GHIRTEFVPVRRGNHANLFSLKDKEHVMSLLASFQRSMEHMFLVCILHDPRLCPLYLLFGLPMVVFVLCDQQALLSPLLGVLGLPFSLSSLSFRLLLLSF